MRNPNVEFVSKLSSGNFVCKGNSRICFFFRLKLFLRDWIFEFLMNSVCDILGDWSVLLWNFARYMCCVLVNIVLRLLAWVRCRRTENMCFVCEVRRTKTRTGGYTRYQIEVCRLIDHCDRISMVWSLIRFPLMRFRIFMLFARRTTRSPLSAADHQKSEVDTLVFNGETNVFSFYWKWKFADWLTMW